MAGYPDEEGVEWFNGDAGSLMVVKKPGSVLSGTDASLI